MNKIYWQIKQLKRKTSIIPAFSKFSLSCAETYNSFLDLINALNHCKQIYSQIQQ